MRFNPVLLQFAAHHRFEPRPVAVARGNEKGRVERSIRYIRDAFFAAREFAGLADLNAQALAWCEGAASDRRWPEDGTLSVREAFDAERASLLALPEREYALGERLAVQVGKTPYARFDLNDYSVPHTHVRRTLSVLADERLVRVFDGAQQIASHTRSWDSGAQIWGEVFPNAACVVSLVDRLMHRAEVVRIEGESYRAKEAQERMAARARQRSGKTGKGKP